MNLSELTKRLEEIASTSLQGLGDEAVLELLNERKTLLVQQEKLLAEAKKKEEEERVQKEKEAKLAEAAQAKEFEDKKQALINRVEEINRSITADQEDEVLLALIQERKILEAELKVFNFSSGAPVISEPVVSEPVASEEPKLPPMPEMKEPVIPPAPAEAEPEPVENITISNTNAFSASSHVSTTGKVSRLEDAGTERVALDSSLQTTEFQGYLSELKANLNSLGTFLQGLPIEVKRNRAFMLEVAKVDPAYAMHYADKDTLKKDEAFNVAIAGMNNLRNTGNPLSEMLPEMRTGAVLLAGVKNDFKNIRFVRPEMPEYESIMVLAKKGAIESVKSLKDAHDVKFLIPPILQKDKEFMAEIQKITAS